MPGKCISDLQFEGWKVAFENSKHLLHALAFSAPQAHAQSSTLQQPKMIAHCQCFYHEILVNLRCIFIAEKNLHVLRQILEKLPDNVCLAFVGDGPAKKDLERHFKGLKVVFTVILSHCVLKTSGQHFKYHRIAFAI